MVPGRRPRKLGQLPYRRTSRVEWLAVHPFEGSGCDVSVESIDHSRRLTLRGRVYHPIRHRKDSLRAGNQAELRLGGVWR